MNIAPKSKPFGITDRIITDRIIMRVQAPISVKYFGAIAKAMQRVAGKENTVYMRDVGGMFEFFTREVQR